MDNADHSSLLSPCGNAVQEPSGERTHDAGCENARTVGHVHMRVDTDVPWVLVSEASDAEPIMDAAAMTPLLR